MLRYENLDFTKMFKDNSFSEFVGYLSTLKSITTENVFGDHDEYKECVDKCCNVVVYAGEITVDPKDTESLKDALNEGYHVVEVEDDRLIMAKSGTLTLKAVVEKLRENIRPYRTVFLHATRLDELFLEEVLIRAREQRS